MLENAYQARLIKKLRELFPGCIILKNDPSYIQGIPDITILWGVRWAMLEDKASAKAIIQPNQSYYVDLLNGMSFAAFICPENEAEILYELQQAFQSGGDSRVP